MPNIYKYGTYSPTKGWEIYTDCECEIAKLQIYNLINCLRAGDRPDECIPSPPAGRTLVEFSTAAWTSFHSRYFRNPSIAKSHREPNWLSFTDSLEKIINSNKSADLEIITEKIYQELVEEHLMIYIETQYQSWHEPSLFGSFRYAKDNEYVALHFLNPFMPDSPFDHMPELIDSLTKIIIAIDKEGTATKTIGMDSWMCNLPQFQKLFPQTFTNSISPTSSDAKTGNGWWGQFILRTGEFNTHRAQALKKSRTFKYIRSHAECSYEIFKKHITQITEQ